MAKKNYLNELHSIENMLGKVRSLNEAMSFDSEYDEMDPEMMGQDEAQEMSAEDEAGNEQEIRIVKTETNNYYIVLDPVYLDKENRNRASSIL